MSGFCLSSQGCSRVLVLKTILQGLADVIFPPQCLSCGATLPERGTLFCHSCHSHIDFIRSPLCSRCGRPFSEPGDKDHLCGDCLQATPVFFTARSLGLYENILLDVVHRFKYGGEVSLGEQLGIFMADSSYPSFLISDYTKIMPVPLHHRRLRQRGFNQALILAREIARRFSLELDFLSLERSVFTEPQVGLDRANRKENIKGAFTVTRWEEVAGRRIILVDDVYTTGSTVRECTKVLMESKAERVAVLTLARVL